MGISKAIRTAVKKIDHKGRVFTHIGAGMAAAGPPLGSQLGQIGVNIANFVKGQLKRIFQTF
jgi:ribosomal protein L11